MAPKLMLCGFKTCPWVQRAAIVLRLKQVPFDITYIDRNNRPDWFVSMSPHGKVPLLIVDGRDALFESGAIAEYLDETLPPRLHPQDPILRARNRAWTDFLPSFAKSANGAAYAKTEQDFIASRPKVAEVFAKIEEALSTRGNDGPYFNGPAFSLVDAGYASILQRHTFIEHLHPLGEIARFPKLSAWRDALLATPAVKESTVPEIETLWRGNLTGRGYWLARFVEGSPKAAAA